MQAFGFIQSWLLPFTVWYCMVIQPTYLYRQVLSTHRLALIQGTTHLPQVSHRNFILHIIHSAWSLWWSVLCIRKYQRILQRFTTQEWLVVHAVLPRPASATPFPSQGWHSCLPSPSCVCCHFSNPLASTLQPTYYFQTALLPIKLNAVHLQPIHHTAHSYSLTDSHLKFNITSKKINQQIINKMHILWLA